MPDNWQRNRDIQNAAAQIVAGADPAIAGMKKGDQVRALLQLRQRLAAETGCSLDTTARHITLGGVLRRLAGR